MLALEVHDDNNQLAELGPRNSTDPRRLGEVREAAGRRSTEAVENGGDDVGRADAGRCTGGGCASLQRLAVSERLSGGTDGLLRSNHRRAEIARYIHNDYPSDMAPADVTNAIELLFNVRESIRAVSGSAPADTLSRSPLSIAYANPQRCQRCRLAMSFPAWLQRGSM